MKNFLLFLLVFPAISNAQFRDILYKTRDRINPNAVNTATIDVGAGLKEALNKGIEKQVSKLTAADGFYKNPKVKILMPDELQNVDKALRSVGLSDLADEGIKSLNRAAEEAVKEATPIFISAVKGMTIRDAQAILMGPDNATTSYLQQTTTAPLYTKFSPVVQESIGKVGADKVWATIISKYNSLPLVSKVNPDINDYVTNKALSGVFTMIAVEEKTIRSNIGSRNSELLKQVFALQDRK